MDGAAPDLQAVARVGAAAQEAHPVDPDAATSAAFIAGYAAGLAEGSGQAEFARAHRASLRAILTVLESEAAPTQEARR